MADVQLELNLISQEATIIFNSKVLDVYQDTETTEEFPE